MSTQTIAPKTSKPVEEKDEIAVRFAGDSGDGMQLAGTQFTTSSAIFGNDISTFPDFPAEIRAPAGSLAGVSGFQINFSNRDIHTPGDAVNGGAHYGGGRSGDRRGDPSGDLEHQSALAAVFGSD